MMLARVGSIVLTALIGGTALAQVNYFQQFKGALTSAKSVDMSLLVKIGSGASQPVKVLLQKPTNALLESRDFKLLSNGVDVVVRKSESGALTKTPYSEAALLQAIDTDLARLWSPFFNPASLDKFKPKSEGQELLSDGSAGVFTFTDPKSGSTYRVLINTSTGFPTEFSISKSTSSEVVKVVVAQCKIDGDVDSGIFAGDSVSAAPKPTGATRAVAKDWNELAKVGKLTIPHGTEVSLKGAMPDRLSSGVSRSATFALYVDGVISARVETNKSWELKWLPTAQVSKDYEVRVEAVQGDSHVDLGKVVVSVRNDFPWRIDEGSIQEDTSAHLKGDFVALRQAKSLSVSVNGLPAKTYLAPDFLRLHNERLIPGRVQISGSVEMPDGLRFDLKPQEVRIEPWIELQRSKTEKILVDRQTWDSAESWSIQTKGNSKIENVRLWVNSLQGPTVKVKENSIQFPIYELFDGSNEVVCEWTDGQKHFFSSPLLIAATITVDAQRMRISDLVNRLRTPQDVLGLYAFLRMLDKLPSELDAKLRDQLIAMMKPKQWGSMSAVIKSLNVATDVRLPLTTDTSFNDAAKVALLEGKTAVEQWAASSALLSIAMGEGQYLRRQTATGLTLAKVVEQMAKALKDAAATSKDASRALTAYADFHAKHPGRTQLDLKRELELASTSADVASNFVDQRRFLDILRTFVLERYNRERMTKFEGEIKAMTDYAFRADLSKSASIFAEICRILAQIDQVNRRIHTLEVALAMATSKEERAATASEISSLRKQVAILIEGARKLRFEAWFIIIACASRLDIDLSKLEEIAAKEDGW